jgi:hypothetical protein
VRTASSDTSPFRCRPLEPGRVDPSAIVLDPDPHGVAVALHGDPDRPSHGLARGGPLVRGLEAVIDRVAEDVVDRIDERVEDRPVQKHVAALDRERRRFAERQSQLADRS